MHKCIENQRGYMQYSNIIVIIFNDEQVMIIYQKHATRTHKPARNEMSIANF